MNKRIILWLCIAVLFSGCGKKFANLFDRGGNTLAVNEVDFDYFTAKLKLDFAGKKNISGVANLRVKKDSLIWASLSPGFGVEVARILISRDSVAVLDKFNKTYTTASFAQLSKEFDFNIDYHLVESVLFGNLIFPYSRERLSKNDKFYSYEQLLGSYHFKNSVGTTSLKLEQVVAQDTLSKSSVLVNYGDFQAVEDQVLPFVIKASLSKGKSNNISTRLDVHYNKAEIDKKQLRFPFSVPDKYERKQKF